MENPSHTEMAVSLHVYIPAFEKCQIFDERTAKRTTVKFTFYSEIGVRTPAIAVGFYMQLLKRELHELVIYVVI